ncbi:hypothetical protein HZH68_004965 [Vespula germanica]|uniref:Uncharacterized protein n=1 Tax=Vespula germanica TaxID=30212 RepID=A0A834KGU0_VESGE|nr:hypothetical protein HZH68_004965 [Vespula germanica]
MRKTTRIHPNLAEFTGIYPILINLHESFRILAELIWPCMELHRTTQQQQTLAEFIGTCPEVINLPGSIEILSELSRTCQKFMRTQKAWGGETGISSLEAENPDLKID